MRDSMCMFDNKNQTLFLQYGNCGLLALEPTFFTLSLCACIFSDLFYNIRYSCFETCRIYAGRLHIDMRHTLLDEKKKSKVTNLSYLLHYVQVCIIIYSSGWYSRVLNGNGLISRRNVTFFFVFEIEDHCCWAFSRSRCLFLYTLLLLRLITFYTSRFVVELLYVCLFLICNVCKIVNVSNVKMMFQKIDFSMHRLKDFDRL